MERRRLGGALSQRKDTGWKPALRRLLDGLLRFT